MITAIIIITIPPGGRPWRSAGEDPVRVVPLREGEEKNNLLKDGGGV